MSGVAVWFGLAASIGKVHWKTVAWEVYNDHSVGVKYEITRPEGMNVRCVLEAQAENHAVIGSKTVELPASLGTTFTNTAMITTTELAVIGQIRRCDEI